MSQHQEANEAIAHRFHMDIFQEGKLQVADEIIGSDFVWRNPIIASEVQRGPKENCIWSYRGNARPSNHA